MRVTLRNNQNLRERWVDTDASNTLGPELAAQLQNDFERRVVNFVAEHGKINISEAIKLMPRPRWHTARDRLLSLVERGILHRNSRYERDPNSHFVLTQTTSD